MTDFIAIVLGASAWPRSERLPGSITFKNSAADFVGYLQAPDGLAISSENILDLFDDDRSVDEIDNLISDFLDGVVCRNGGRDPKNVIVYYTGHGAFVEGENKYCLLLRNSRLSSLSTSAYRMLSFARQLNRKVPHSRRFVVIDACFAASALPDFIPQSDAAFRIRDETISVLTETGTALLCAASSADVALSPKDSKYTMFSGALLNALNIGSEQYGPKLSFDDLHFLAERFVVTEFRDMAVKPEIHIPDQRRGSIAKLRLFPNKAFMRTAPGFVLHSQQSFPPVDGKLAITPSENGNSELVKSHSYHATTSNKAKVLPYLRSFALKGKSFVLQHSKFVISVGVLMLISIAWPIVQGPSCQFLKLESLATKDGDYFVDDGNRPCERRSTVAIETYSWANHDLNSYVGKSEVVNQPLRKGLITGSMLINGAAVVPGDRATWYGRDIFGMNERQLWTAKSPQQDTFLEGGCEFDPEDVSNEFNRESRSGIRLTSTKRSDPELALNERLRCNRLPDTDPTCKRAQLEIFIQSQSPENWCSERTFYDRLLWWRGTKKKYLVLPSSTLKAAARNRFDQGNEKDVPQAEWKKLTEGMPDLCMRWVDLDGKPRSRWWT